jgi:2-keto-3-deoxy-L-fuconate dehydrogenase
MTQRLAGKTVLVTAAGQGIGRASALALMREGAQVWATDIDDRLLEALQAEGAIARCLDVRDDNAINALAAEVGTLDVLFNCAGFVHHGTLMDVLLATM